MVFAFGWGVGSLIAAEVSGLPYLSFVGAGVLAFTVLSRSMFETAYGSYFRMVYQNTFDAILATPVEPESLAFAEISWAATKALIDSFIILIVLLVFGAAPSWLALHLRASPARTCAPPPRPLVVTAHVRGHRLLQPYLASSSRSSSSAASGSPARSAARAANFAWLIPLPRRRPDPRPPRRPTLLAHLYEPLLGPRRPRLRRWAPARCAAGWCLRAPSSISRQPSAVSRHQ